MSRNDDLILKSIDLIIKNLEIMNLLLRHILWGVLMITLSLSSLYAQPKIVGSNYKYGVIDIKTGTQICDTIYNSKGGPHGLHTC